MRRIPRASLIFLSLALAAQFSAGATPAQNCGGTERWGPKDGTDPQALSIDLTNITPEVVADLVTIHSAAAARRQQNVHCSRRDARLPGAVTAPVFLNREFW